MIATVRKAGGLRATETMPAAMVTDQSRHRQPSATRLNHGNPGTHPLQGPTQRMLHDWKHQHGISDYVFHVDGRRADGLVERSQRLAARPQNRVVTTQLIIRDPGGLTTHWPWRASWR
jgi:hypothetical protein